MEADRGEVGINILCTPDGSEFTQIIYNRQNSRLSLIRTHSSLDERAYRDGREGELELAQGEDLDLRVFIDHSVIEIFANQRVSLTARAYPTQPDSTGVQVLARGGKALLKKLEAWQIKTIW
jgi:beta-fructofuranosidase